MKSKAIIFDLKYEKNNAIKYNHSNYYLCDFDVVKIYRCDVSYTKVTKTSIINSIYKLALDSHRFKLDTIYIFFQCNRCINNENTYDCTFYPIDYKESGAIEKNLIKEILKQFYFETKAVCIFDYYDKTLKKHFRYEI